MKPVKLAICMTMLASLPACSLIPDYQRPKPLVDTTQVKSEPGITVADLGWRQFYLDPALQKLINMALTNNQSLRASSLTVEQLKQQYQIQRAAERPTINADGSASRDRTPASVSQSRQDYISKQYKVGLGISSWEIDFFGRLNSLSQAALQQYLSTQSARDSAQLTLIADVADAWFSWQALRAEAKLAQDTQNSRQKSYALTQKKFENGVASELDVSQAETAVHEAAVLVAQYQQQANQQFTTLQLLVGTNLNKKDWQANWNKIATLRDIPANLTSDVLLKRPDVMQAEHQIEAANANIGAARAAFFPRISLTSAIGLTGTAPAQLTDTGNRYWQISPQFSLPLLDWGTKEANLKVSKLQKQIDIANYQQTIQQAFKDVRDEMEARYTLDQQLKAQNDITKSTTRSLQLAQKRYDAGVDSYLDVLGAQRTLLNSQLSQIDISLQRLRNQLTLYKALGGGLYEQSKQQKEVSAKPD